MITYIKDPLTTYKDKKVWTAALALLNIEGVGYYAAKMG